MLERKEMFKLNAFDFISMKNILSHYVTDGALIWGGYFRSGDEMEKGGRVAPNGKPSNLTPEQYKLVRTPAFKKWFGDWENDPKNASKVLDENGEPLVVYHGGSFNGSGEFGGVGWFTAHKDDAKYYSRQSGGHLIKVFLSIKKPYYAGQVGKKYVETNNAVIVASRGDKFDGVIDRQKGSEIIDAVVWRSNNIKLADGSNKTFDSKNVNIEMAGGGEAGGNNSSQGDDFGNSEKRSNFVSTNKAIQDVISGKSKVRHGTTIQAVASHLRGSAGASSEVKGSKLFKEQEAERIRLYATEYNLWTSVSDFKKYLSEGAEQKVYFIDGKNVIKVNDSIFYISWEDYFHSLLLHNYFFPDTAYELIGFADRDGDLCAVVKQPFVVETEKTDLGAVKKIMLENGFVNTKNNDYRNSELGIILEDLHDENVLTKDGILYFVDTVFYITPNVKLAGGGEAGMTRKYNRTDKVKLRTPCDYRNEDGSIITITTEDVGVIKYRDDEGNEQEFSEWMNEIKKSK
jgi:hypothetical protein